MSRQDNLLETIAETKVDIPAETVTGAVADAVEEGLLADRKWLPAWLFYDGEGSRLFEQITVVPEYYLTRTERAIFKSHADGMIDAAMGVYARAAGALPGAKLRLMELGAGSASKTGILLAAAVRRQGATDYLPIDVSVDAMQEAQASLARILSSVTVWPQVANYVTDALVLPPFQGPTLALYIGSSIGNFAPEEASAILRNLRAQLRPGDSLLLGTDLVKDVRTLLAAYDDSSGVTGAFNLNILRRVNRDLHADFNLAAFRHVARWNAAASRMEMHLESVCAQIVHIATLTLRVSFRAGECIHTENSYKFTQASITTLLQDAGFTAIETWKDEQDWFAVTLASAQ